MPMAMAGFKIDRTGATRFRFGLPYCPGRATCGLPWVRGVNYVLHTSLTDFHYFDLLTDVRGNPYGFFIKKCKKNQLFFQSVRRVYNVQIDTSDPP